MKISFVCFIYLFLFSNGFIFNESVAFRYFSFAKASNCHPDVLKSWNCTSCKWLKNENVSVVGSAFSAPDSFAFVGNYNVDGLPRVVVAFRGIKGFWGGMQDLKFWKNR